MKSIDFAKILLDKAEGSPTKFFEVLGTFIVKKRQRKTKFYFICPRVSSIFRVWTKKLYNRYYSKIKLDQT
jgi:hypothetical protein